MRIDDHFHVEVCDWANATDREALTNVRETVFVFEQHVPPEMEIDDDDPRCVHVLARTAGGDPVGAGRLTTSVAAPARERASTAAPNDRTQAAVQDDDALPDAGRIARMAVLRDWRGRGVGTALLRTLIEQARARGLPEVSLHAQCDAVPFYQRHGFSRTGAEFEEAGIAHVCMRRALAAAAGPERPSLPPPPESIALHATSREELIVITKTLLMDAKHSMCVWVRELHPLLFNDTACLVELRRLAISGRGASIRIIAQDLTRATEEGTRLLELAQRLSSVIELRRPVEPDDLAYRSAFMCVDTGGYLFRPLEQEMVTSGATRAPGPHAVLMRLFEDVWARSEPWTELRALGI
ncbi:MAG: GNAT family N-acetyltransferase [Rhodanobacteraceae bacterium]